MYDREISLMKQLMYQVFLTLFLNNDLKSALFYICQNISHLFVKLIGKAEQSVRIPFLYITYINLVC